MLFNIVIGWSLQSFRPLLKETRSMNVTTRIFTRNVLGAWSVLGASACLVLAAMAPGCSDETGTSSGSASSGEGGSVGSASSAGSGGEGGTASIGSGGAGGAGGSAGGAGGSAEEAKPKVVALSDAGHDRFFGVTFDTKGNIYATGVIASSTDAAADFSTVVVKFLPTGELDATFGTGGVATHNLAVGTNGEVTRGIVVQSTGKIVVAGTVEHAGAVDPRDRDIAAARLNADGSLDTTFGTNGIAILDLSEGEVVGMGYVADTHWGLSLYPDDDLLLVGAQKAPGRTDLDFAAVRLNADGSRDDTFGTNGVTLLDINQQGANPRTGTILADGSAVITGYTRDADDIVSPVLFKLTSTGQLDPAFGVGGVFNQIVLGSITEAYGATLQGTSFVTVGYGKNTAAETLDWISLRVSAAGTLDTTYGKDGVASVDVAGQNDNGRAIITLGDDRVLLVGGGRPAADNVDAMVAVLTPDGKPDATFAAKGFATYDIGGASDFFWGAALSPDKKVAAIVGTMGVAMGAGDDDAALFLLPISK
jgi:uncharacterized delta-60 repeat protein